MSKSPDPVSAGSRPEALPVSFHISADVSGRSAGAPRFPRAALLAEAMHHPKTNPHLSFCLSLSQRDTAGPGTQRGRNALDSLFASYLEAENREGYSQKAACFQTVSLVTSRLNETPGVTCQNPVSLFTYAFFLSFAFQHNTKKLI